MSRQSASRYHIVDEPKVRSKERLIVNPIIILFMSMLVPLFWYPPFNAENWAPLIWLMMNSYFLGSPTFRWEVLASIFGMLLSVTFKFFVYVGLQQFDNEGLYEQISLYVYMVERAIFFFFMYLVVFKQMAPYELFRYLKDFRQQ